MQLKIVKKSWKVWDSHAEGRHNPEYYESVHAETANKARARIGYENSYLDVRCIREKKYDQVLYNGEVMSREYAEEKLKQEKRKDKIKKLPDDTLFYVQHGYVGNDGLFWALECCGYTCNYKNFHKFTKEEILKRTWRNDDTIRQCNEIDKHVKSVIDMQYPKYDFSY